MYKYDIKKQSDFLLKFQGKLDKIGQFNQIGIADHKNNAIKQRSGNNWPNAKIKYEAEYQENSKIDNVSSSKRSYKSLPKQSSRKSQILSKIINIKTQNTEQQIGQLKNISKSVVFQKILKLPSIYRSSSQKDYGRNNLNKLKYYKKQEEKPLLKAINLIKAQQPQLRNKDKSRKDFDDDVMQHLKYLQRFEKELIYNKLSKGKKLNSN